MLAQLNARKAVLNKTINGKIQMTEDKLKMVQQTKTFTEKIQKNWSEVEILNVRKQVKYFELMLPRMKDLYM